MTWTTDKPTIPGWYWWRGDYPERNPKRVVELYLNLDNVLTAICSCGMEMTSLDDLRGQWAGPIEEPVPHE